jgi:elongation factor 1 alpha-like protein
MKVAGLPTCSKPFSFADFFKDSPWLNIPMDRQAIFIAPLYPRGGLLGGSSDGAPKMSKLQALAAARKKKAQEQKANEGTGVEKPMAGLTLNEGRMGNGGDAPKPSSRSFPLRKRKDSNPHEKVPKASPVGQEQSDPDTQMDITPLDQAESSAFANTMFSSPTRPHPSNLFTLPYVATTAAQTQTADPFAGPSPDDIVIAAQSKGSTILNGPKK